DTEDEWQRARDAIGKRPLDDALRQGESNAEQQQVEKRQDLSRDRQREDGEQLEHHRREWRVNVPSGTREVAVVQRSPGREVAPGLPEHVKIAADRLSLAAVDGDHHRDSANAGCESEPAGAPRSGDYGEAAGQTQLNSSHVANSYAVSFW